MGKLKPNSSNKWTRKKYGNLPRDENEIVKSIDERKCHSKPI